MNPCRAWMLGLALILTLSACCGTSVSVPAEDPGTAEAPLPGEPPPPWTPSAPSPAETQPCPVDGDCPGGNCPLPPPRAPSNPMTFEAPEEPAAPPNYAQVFSAPDEAPRQGQHPRAGPVDPAPTPIGYTFEAAAAEPGPTPPPPDLPSLALGLIWGILIGILVAKMLAAHPTEPTQ